MASLLDIDFGRCGFQVHHTVHGFDLVCEFSPEVMFQCVAKHDTWQVAVHMGGLREIYGPTQPEAAFLRLLDNTEIEVAAYQLPSNGLALYLYLIGYANQQGFNLTREDMALLTKLPIPFERKIHALRTQGGSGIYHVVKSAEMTAAEFSAWAHAFVHAS